MLQSEQKRKKLMYQSWYRGCKETDRIIGTFAKLYLNDFNDDELNEWETILEESDNDLFDWLTGKAPVPEKYAKSEVMQRLTAFDYSQHI